MILKLFSLKAHFNTVLLEGTPGRVVKTWLEVVGPNPGVNYGRANVF